MNENCDHCHTDYAITKDNARLYVFLEYYLANHIVAVCPNGHTERIFVTSQGFVQVVAAEKLGITFFIEPDEELRAASERTWAKAIGELIPEQGLSSEIPHHMLRELYDQLREFESRGDDAA